MENIRQELFSCSLLAIQDEKLNIEHICINDILEQSIAGFYGVLINKRILPDIQMSEIRVMRQHVNGVDSFAFYFTAKAKKDICRTLDILGNRLICTLHQRISVLYGLE